jgi:mRNA interferase RelE/StbE
MKIQVHKTFLKELSKLPTRERKKVENLLFIKMENFESPLQIPNLEKLKGYKNNYKIRFGDYRAGLRIVGKTIYFERILHRKDIYKFYP